jgi:hypothetical protein
MEVMTTNAEEEFSVRPRAERLLAATNARLCEGDAAALEGVASTGNSLRRLLTNCSKLMGLRNAEDVIFAAQRLITDEMEPMDTPTLNLVAQRDSDAFGQVISAAIVRVLQ